MASITERSYGIHRRVAAENEIDDACETLWTLGYAVLEGGYTQTEIDELSAAFDDAVGIRKMRRAVETT